MQFSYVDCLKIFKTGDIIGFSGRGCLSGCINIATYGVPSWGISHVGIIGSCLGANNGRLLLYESTMEDDLPCAITDRRFFGAQAHEIAEAINIYNGRVWHYPLYRSLYYHEQERLCVFLNKTIGTPYDAMGACRAGGIGLSWIESLFREEDLSAIFCSEWIAAVYGTIGLYPISNASRWNPNRLCRTFRHCGILRKPMRMK